MSAITDFTNKRFSTSNRVHKMFHETTISLHSLQLHWITILLLAEITAFVFNVATKFVFVSAALQFPGRGGKWRAPITHTVNGMALVHTWHLQRDGDALREKKNKKIIKMAGSFPTLQPSPSVLQKALQQPTEHARHLGEKSRARACDISHLGLWLCVRRELVLAGGVSQVWETGRGLEKKKKKEKTLNGHHLNGRWRRQDIPFSLWQCLSICTLF